MTPEVEKLLPFVLRAKLLVMGRERLRRLRKRLHFVWISTDISENSRREILRDLAGCPVVQAGRSSDFEEWLGLHNTKVLGLRKSSLAREVFRHLKPWVIRVADGASAPSTPRKRGTGRQSQEQSG